MQKILIMLIALFAVAACTHHDKDEEQGGGERVESQSPDDETGVAD